MEKHPAEKQAAPSKMSSERLRSKLAEAGYDEQTFITLDRNTLLNMYAEYLYLKTPLDKAPGGLASGGEVSTEKRSEREIRLREQELELRRMKMEKDREKEEKEFELRERGTSDSGNGGTTIGKKGRGEKTTTRVIGRTNPIFWECTEIFPSKNAG